MPTYEYRCSAGHHFEQVQRMSEEPLKECPQCGAPAERLLSAGGGLLFKGSGFYITDYRSDSYRKAAEADSAKPKDAGGSKEASSGGKESSSGSKEASSGGKEASSGGKEASSGGREASSGGKEASSGGSSSSSSSADKKAK